MNIIKIIPHTSTSPHTYPAKNYGLIHIFLFFLVCATKYKKIKTKSIYRGRVAEYSGFHGMTDTHLILEYYILLQKRNKYTQKKTAATCS